MSFFSQREVTIATKHGKEHCMAPLLESALNVKCSVPPNFDTDAFGSFCGTTPRTENPLATAKLKCMYAMQLTGSQLAIASEGSFGPHPESLLGHVDEELVLLVDRKNNLEIFGRAVSTSTNFGGMVVRSEKELLEFARKVLFPSHGLMIRRSKDHPVDLYKGLTNLTDLRAHFKRLLAKYGEAYVETDMRAMLNPSRMRVITMATENLIHKALTNCPVCQFPGFGIVDARPGLPCSRCGFPTRSVSSYIYSCGHCGHRQEKENQDQPSEDPQFCDNCNP